MSTTPVQASAASAATAAATTATGLPANQTINQQQFLTLFLAQLKNQDPLSPLQPDQLTSQLAQFSSLEQLTGINSRLDTLAGNFKQDTTGALIALIGKQVSFDGSQIGLKAGKAPDIGYMLAASADKVTATIRNSSGQVVRTVELGPLGPGEHTFKFDGRSGNGALLADGTYKVEVTLSAKGNDAPTQLSLLATDTVEGVDMTSSTPSLLVGGREIGLDQVKQVR
jgi:flagellar basal-body rod modification protein FlgD